jgi:hypothetical protein
MIYKFDHVGITVPSLEEAKAQLNFATTHTCFHTQLGMETGSALCEVSIHQPTRFSISLHKKPNSIAIELMEYGKVDPLRGSIFPWFFSPQDINEGLAGLKSVVRGTIERAQEKDRIADVLSQFPAQRSFNAVVIAVEDLEAEAAFWQALRFRKIVADQEMAVLALTSLFRPADTHYILLFKVDYVTARYTDAQGINEIALLCSSCQASLNDFREDVSRTSVSVFPVNGKEISLGYLRSPSGVLGEVFSVGIAANGIGSPRVGSSASVEPGQTLWRD